MRVRITEGNPREDDIFAALTEAMSSVKIPEARPREIYLSDCLFCKESDTRREDGVPQGTISYSLDKHCLTCAKCGTSHGWVEVLDAIDADKSFEDDEELQPMKGSISDVSSRVRRSMKKEDKSEDSYVDHGDWKVDVNVAAEHHARRLMSEGSRVRKWLDGRGFTFSDDYAEDMSKAWAGESAAGWLVIIYRDVDGGIRGFKYRNIEAKEFWAQKGVQSDLYGIEGGIDDSSSAGVIVEGELDDETLKQVYGVKNCRSLPNGNNSWKLEWSKHFAGLETVYVATDNDEAGDVAASKIFADLTKALPDAKRMLRVRFRNGAGTLVKDANQAYMEGATKEQIVQAFIDAEDPDLVTSERAEMNTRSSFFRTNWPSVDETLGGGCLTGEVIHLAGAAKSGKTTLLASLHQSLCDRKIRNGIVSLDMDTGKILVRMAMGILGKEDAEFYRTEPDSAERAGYVQMMTGALQGHMGHLLFTRDRRISTYKDAMAAVERMCKAGAKIVSIEDFLTLATMLEATGKGKSNYAGSRVVRDLCDIADRCQSAIILVNHMKSDESGTQSYGAGQIGPRVQANVSVSAERDEDGNMTATVMHIIENRHGSKANVDISLSFKEGTRVLVAGPPSLHKKRRGKGKKKDGPF